MTKILFENISYTNHPDETVLETLIRHGVDVSFSCKAGICHTCIMHLLSGELNAVSYKGLSAQELNDDKFLPCQCYPKNDIEISRSTDGRAFQPAVVVDKQLLADDVLQLIIEPETHFFFHGGQFVNLKSPDQVIRSYSIANTCSAQDGCDPGQIELHIQRVPQGRMSGWLFDHLAVGGSFEIQGPMGQCHYPPDGGDESLLLIGRGTGLAPLLGVVREALEKDHAGPITLYHGAQNRASLYLHEELLTLQADYRNFSYYPCADTVADSEPDVHQGPVVELAFSEVPSLQAARVYLCGAPRTVYAARQRAETCGAVAERMYFDVFETPHDVTSDPATHYDEGDVYPEPAPDIWRALDEGKTLKKILTRFYDRVYEDPVLSPYFVDFSKHHVIGKQYSFLYKAFTGEDIYFGDRPRNAHHWMVITDEIFDYRERLFESVLIEFEIAEDIRQRFLQLHESYRSYIVKEKPWPKILHGITQPIEGFEQIELGLDYLCDNCAKELLKGETVQYQLRDGKIFCASCTASEAA